MADALPHKVEKVEITITLNGKKTSLSAPPMKRLLDVLRYDLQLTGSKEGCGEGECGACSVFLNGALVNSCLVPIGQLNGQSVTTIEAMSADRDGRQVQEAFLHCGASQCGICTPGMVMAAVNLRRHNQSPSREQVREALSGNLCRCTGYTKIIAAVESLSCN